MLVPRSEKEIQLSGASRKLKKKLDYWCNIPKVDCQAIKVPIPNLLMIEDCNMASQKLMK